MIDVTFDESLGILRCVSQGASTVAEVEAFVAKTIGLQDRARQRHGVCLVLVDAPQGLVTSQETAAIFDRSARERLRPGDRTAIILDSAIARMQSKRLIGDHPTAFFDNEADAVAWLLADAG